MKEKKRPTYYRTAAAIALLLFAVCVVFIFRNYRMSFSTIEGIVVDGDIICGVSSDGAESVVFYVSAKTGVGNFRRLGLTSDDRIVTVFNPSVSDKGVFRYQRDLYDIDGTVTEQNVYWDITTDKIRRDPEVAVDFHKDPEQFDPDVQIGRSASFATHEETYPARVDVIEHEGKTMLRYMERDSSYILSGVRRPAARIAGHLLVAAVCCGAIFFSLLLAGNLAYRRKWSMGIRLRLCVYVVLMILLLAPVAGHYLQKYLFAYAGRYALYHCADEAVISASALNEELVAGLISGEETFDTETRKELWKYGGQVVFPGESVDEEEDFLINAIRKWNNQDQIRVLMDLAFREDRCLVYLQNKELITLYDPETTRDPWVTKTSLSLRRRLVRTFETGQAQSCIMVMGQDRYAAVFLPFPLSSGDTVLVGVRIPVNSVLMLFALMWRDIYRVCLIIGGLLLVVLPLWISRSLHSLSSLKKAVDSVTDGNLSVRADERGFNEISYTAYQFNRMVDQLEEESAGVDSFRRFYDAFLPASLLRRLSGRTVSGALHAASAYGGQGVCMVISEGYAVPNRIFTASSDPEDIITCAKQHGGHLADISDTKARVIYTEGTDAALYTAVDLQQEHRRQDRPVLACGISLSPVTLYVPGNRKRMAVSEHDDNQAAKLSEIAAFLRLPAVLTEEVFMAMKRGRSHFHFRRLGRMQTEDYTSPGPLYELLDAEGAEERAGKEHTLMLFEQGVQAYETKDYFYARNAMIRVLEDDPSDLAARCYILNMDKEEVPAICQVKA